MPELPQDIFAAEFNRIIEKFVTEAEGKRDTVISDVVERGGYIDPLPMAKHLFLFTITGFDPNECPEKAINKICQGNCLGKSVYDGY